MHWYLTYAARQVAIVATMCLLVALKMYWGYLAILLGIRKTANQPLLILFVLHPALQVVPTLLAGAF